MNMKITNLNMRVALNKNRIPSELPSNSPGTPLSCSPRLTRLVETEPLKIAKAIMNKHKFPNSQITPSKYDT